MISWNKQSTRLIADPVQRPEGLCGVLTSGRDELDDEEGGTADTSMVQ